MFEDRTCDFTYDPAIPRIVFGPGKTQRLDDELERLGVSRALLVTTARGAAALGTACIDRTRIACTFADARMHVPVEVIGAALDRLTRAGADGIVAFGGGSAIGLAKALAYRTGLPQIMIPTTYSGSEMTCFYGETEGGVKRGKRAAAILARTVIYDPDHTLSLPPTVAVPSAMNAVAHGVEALYAPDRNPFISSAAESGVAACITAAEAMADGAKDRRTCTQALYGAWLCGIALNAVEMGLHHRLCHALGGAFDLPHAETHAILLPHVLGFNAAAVPETIRRLQAVLHVDRPQDRMVAVARRGGVPASLRAIGMPEEGIDRVVEHVLAALPNPGILDAAGLHDLLAGAWTGTAPA